MHEFDQEAFEQPSGYVSVGLVIVLTLLVCFFDFRLLCREQGRLDIVIDKRRMNVPDESGQAMPAIIDGIGREVGQFQKGFECVTKKRGDVDAAIF